MAGAEVDDWYALLTARTGDIQRSREISARLARLDEPGILSGVASRMISENARFCWYIGPICDRLPAAGLRQLAGEAARARGEGGNEAADEVIAYASVHQPGALTAYLRALWDIRPNSCSYYASWPWRAADDAEVTRLLEVAGDAGGPDAGFAVRCLPETRRPDVLARLPADDDLLAMVGFGRDGSGGLRRLHAPDGTPEPLTAGRSRGLDREPESFAGWFIPQTPVELARLDERWWQQDWALSNDRENLHRAGGEPTWIQNADYPACPGCTRTMSAVGQIAVADLWNAEGICYLLWRDPCAISAIIYQQT